MYTNLNFYLWAMMVAQIEQISLIKTPWKWSQRVIIVVSKIACSEYYKEFTLYLEKSISRGHSLFAEVNALKSHFEWGKRILLISWKHVVIWVFKSWEVTFHIKFPRLIFLNIFFNVSSLSHVIDIFNISCSSYIVYAVLLFFFFVFMCYAVM